MSREQRLHNLLDDIVNYRGGAHNALCDDYIMQRAMEELATLPEDAGCAIVAAYERGAAWAWENGADAKPYLRKAACDYEDAHSAIPAAPATGQEG